MYRKGVSALIINKNREFLLVNLVSFEERYFAIPGGGVEDGESLEEAVYREIEEELGIGKKSLLLIGKSDLPIMIKFKTIKFNNDGMEFDGMERYFFGFKFIGSDSDIKLKKDEVRACRWVSFSELSGYLLFDNQLGETIEKIVEIFPLFKIE